MVARAIAMTATRAPGAGLATLGANTFTGTQTINGGLTISDQLGAAAAGTTIALQFSGGFTGDSGGTSDVRYIVEGFTASGSQSISSMILRNSQMEAQHTAGTLATANVEQSYFRLGLLGSATGAVTTAKVFFGHVANESAGSAIGTARVFDAGGVDLASGAGTVGSMIAYNVGDQGHATKVTVAAIGIDIVDFTGGAPITSAIRSAMTSGTGKKNLNFTGSAVSVHLGNFAIGTTNAPSNPLDIVKNSDGATTYALHMSNNGGSANTAVALSLDPGANGTNSRDALIRATNNGGNAITLDFLLANGGAPATTLTINPNRSATLVGPYTILNATAINSGGTAGNGYKFTSTSNFGIFPGSGAPTLAAAQGSLYLRSDGSSTITRAYINTDGGTTWTPITTVG